MYENYDYACEHSVNFLWINKKFDFDFDFNFTVNKTIVLAFNLSILLGKKIFDGFC